MYNKFKGAKILNTVYPPILYLGELQTICKCITFEKLRNPPNVMDIDGVWNIMDIDGVWNVMDIDGVWNVMDIDGVWNGNGYWWGRKRNGYWWGMIVMDIDGVWNSLWNYQIFEKSSWTIHNKSWQRYFEIYVRFIRRYIMLPLFLCLVLSIINQGMQGWLPLT